MDKKILTDGDISPFFPERERGTHKGDYGTAQLIVGSEKYVGAAALCAEACLRSGCGYIKLLSAEKVKYALAPHIPQVIFNDEPDLNASCIAIGSGSGVSDKLYSTIKGLLSDYRGTLIIDADGLNALSGYGVDILKNKTCNVLLTPHIKEFSRLTGLEVSEILSSPEELAKKFAKEYGVTLILKNAYSVISDGEKTYINTAGTTALAKAGSGDMLTGFLAGTVARGVKPLYAAAVAAFVMGRAAEITSRQTTDYCATAKEILINLSEAVKSLTAK